MTALAASPAVGAARLLCRVAAEEEDLGARREAIVGLARHVDREPCARNAIERRAAADPSAELRDAGTPDAEALKR